MKPLLGWCGWCQHSHRIGGECVTECHDCEQDLVDEAAEFLRQTTEEPSE